VGAPPAGAPQVAWVGVPPAEIDALEIPPGIAQLGSCAQSGPRPLSVVLPMLPPEQSDVPNSSTVGWQVPAVALHEHDVQPRPSLIVWKITVECE
jgi:hypothetical protein